MIKKVFHRCLLCLNTTNVLIIHGFLSNLNFTTNEKLIYDASSRLPNIHNLIENKNISERTIINYCKTLNIKKIQSSIKENYLY